MVKEVARCTGHCCRDFSLPVSPMELKREAAKAKLGKSRFPTEEILNIADMVIFLFQDWMPSTRDRRYKKDRGTKKPYHNASYHYTCRHFDAATGNCTNYENRPRMCRDYPYGSKCGYAACTRREECVAAREVIDKQPDQEVTCPSTNA